MDTVQALAILSLGAFLTVLVTAIFYVFTVRPRLLEPVPLEAVGLIDETLQEELAKQRVVVERLNTALSHHTAQLEAAAGIGLGEGLEPLRGMLRSQNEATASLTALLSEQSTRLSGLDDRLSRQETAFATLSQRLGDVSLPGIAALVQAQADRLVTISTRLDEWAATGAQNNDQLAEHARVLAGLDREMAAHAQILQRLDAKASEHTTMLVTAATERREQAGVLERVVSQVGRLFPLIEQIVTGPPRPDQDRLTDIKGIGPVYAGKLYEAGIHTFRQLAAMTPEELQTVIGEPKWRWRGVDAESWIEQAQHFASQREKVESLS